MKNIIKTFFNVFVISIISLICFNTKASAWQDVSYATGDENRIAYVVNTLEKNGNYLHIDGWAYILGYQNYYDWNHDYWIRITGSDGSDRVYTASKFQQGTNLTYILHVNGRGNCPDVGAGSDCGRIINYAGFSADIPLTDLAGDVTYTLRLRIRETAGGIREFESVINAPYRNLPTVEVGHNLFHINNQWDSSRVYVGSLGVLMRKAPTKTTAAFKANEWPFHGRYTKSAYWNNTWYYNVYEYQLNGEGLWWRLGFSAPGIYTNAAFGWTEWGDNGNTTSAWISGTRGAVYGPGIQLYSSKKSYINGIQVETKTARVGTKATVKGVISNSTGVSNPAIVQIFVDNQEVYNSGVQTWAGSKTFSKDIDATSYARTVKVRVTETTNNYVKEMTSTLYPASNQTNTVSNGSGTIRGNNPIYVIKNSSGTANYYENITYNQNTYYTLDNSNTLSRSVSLSYSTNYGGIATWDNGRISGTNTISSPSSSYNLTKTASSGTSVTLSADKTVTYTDLNSKNMTTKVSNIGVNNITINMNANYQFIDASNINLIDTRTHDANSNGEVYVTINNSKNRTVHYKIYYKDTLLTDKTETWNGDKIVSLTPNVVDKDYIRVEIIQPNTIPESLKGEINVATKETVDIKTDGTYTSPTPVRVNTYPSSVKKFFETIKITSLDKNINIKAGEGFENRIKVEYMTTDDIYDLASNIIVSNAAFTQKDGDCLDYAKQSDGTYIVGQEKIAIENKSITTALPEYVLDKKTGEVCMKNNTPDGYTAINGGRKWYIPMDAVNGNYDYKTTFTNVGINKITFNVDNNYNVVGSLFGNPNAQSKYKVIRVKNPANPNYTWHKSYTMSELLESFKK